MFLCIGRPVFPYITILWPSRDGLAHTQQQYIYFSSSFSFWGEIASFLSQFSKRRVSVDAGVIAVVPFMTFHAGVVDIASKAKDRRDEGEAPEKRNNVSSCAYSYNRPRYVGSL